MEKFTLEFYKEKKRLFQESLKEYFGQEELWTFESNNGVYTKLVDILTGYEILINLKNLWRFKY